MVQAHGATPTRPATRRPPRRIDEETEPAYELLKVAPNPIAIKAALNLLGHEVGGHRLPLVPATDGGDRARCATASTASGCVPRLPRRPRSELVRYGCVVRRRASVAAPSTPGCSRYRASSASITFGQNCVPAWARSSSIAAGTVRAER